MKLKEINNHLPSTIFDQSCSGACIIIGSGPTQNKLLENKEWQDYYTISANWSQIYFPSQIYCWQDGGFIGQTKAILAKKQHISCSILPTSKKSIHNEYLMKNIGGIYVNRIPSRERPKWLGTKDSTNMTSCSPISGAIAACMAYTMGFSPIILIGFDCNDGDYKYLKKHPNFGYFNQRAARKHAQTQVRLLKNFGEDMGIINCSDTDAMIKHNFDKTLASINDPNRKRCQSIVKDIFIEQCKQNGMPFINEWKKKIPV